MNIYKTKYLAAVVIVILVIVSAVAFTKSSKRRGPPTVTQEEKRGVDKPPMITSCVKNIKILKKEMKDPDAETPLIAVEVENTGDVGIIAISLESVKEKVDYYVLVSSFGAEAPIVIIEPHGRRTITIEASNILQGAHLQNSH